MYKAHTAHRLDTFIPTHTHPLTMYGGSTHVRTRHTHHLHVYSRNTHLLMHTPTHAHAYTTTHTYAYTPTHAHTQYREPSSLGGLPFEAMVRQGDNKNKFTVRNAYFPNLSINAQTAIQLWDENGWHLAVVIGLLLSCALVNLYVSSRLAVLEEMFGFLPP